MCVCVCVCVFLGLQTSQAGGFGTGFFKQGGLVQSGGLGTSIGGILHYTCIYSCDIHELLQVLVRPLV